MCSDDFKGMLQPSWMTERAPNQWAQVTEIIDLSLESLEEELQRDSHGWLTWINMYFNDGK